MADNDEFMRPTIRVIITLFILAIVNAIIGSLPGINTQIPGMYMWNIPTIISAVIATIMIIVLWRYSVTIGPIVEKQYPKFPEIRTVATNIIYLICLFIAYGAYRHLLGQFLYTLTWIYDLAFLLVGLYLAYIIARILLKSSDKISDVILHDVKQATGERKECKKCSTSNPATNKFCDKCGSRLE
jgi:uncharacterized protein YacL